MGEVHSKQSLELYFSTLRSVKDLLFAPLFYAAGWDAGLSCQQI